MRMRLSMPGSAKWTIGFKKGSGTFVRSTLRAVPAKVPDPFLNHAKIGLFGLLIALASAGLATAQTNQASPAPLKHYTKEPVFHLPIKFDEKSRSNILKVQLFVKTATGEWRKPKTEAPADTKSLYLQTPADGEYWFTLVTFDFRGERTPQNLNRLGSEDIVMVIVDTQAPTFDLLPVKAPNGDVLLRCVVTDANPDYKAVRVAYRGTDLAMHNLEQVPGQQGAFRVPGPEIFDEPMRVTVTDLALNTTTREVNLQDTAARLWPGRQTAPSSCRPFRRFRRRLPA